MSEQGEHELTDTQRRYWRRFVEFHNAEETGRALFPNDAEIVAAVDARLAWLEACEAERKDRGAITVYPDPALSQPFPAAQASPSAVISEPNEPRLTAEQRAEFEKRIASARRFRERSADSAFQAAVGDRFAWLEAERAHLHARADRATAELLALGREVRQARGEVEEMTRQRDAANQMLSGQIVQTHHLLEGDLHACEDERDNAVSEQHRLETQYRILVERQQGEGADWIIRIGEVNTSLAHAVAEAAVLRRFIQASEVLEYVAAAVVRQPLNDVTPVAAKAAAVLEAAPLARAAWIALTTLDGNADSAASEQATAHFRACQDQADAAVDAYVSALAGKEPTV